MLQRGKQSITAIPSQTPKKPRDDRYVQGQNYSWYNNYVEPEYWNGYRTGYSYRPGHGHGNKSWGQGNGHGKKYGTGDKKRQGRLYGASGVQSLFLIEYGSGWLLLAVAFAFIFSCGSCSMNCIGECCENVP